MKGILFITFLILIVFTLMIYGFNVFSLREKYTNYSCNIGENETTGDFKVEPDTWFNNRQCSIEDCSAFNKIQKENNIKMRCVI